MAINILKSEFITSESITGSCPECDLTKGFSSQWYLVNDIPHFFKLQILFEFEYMINELLGEEFCKLINLKSAKYSIVQLDSEAFSNIYGYGIRNSNKQKYSLITRDFKESNKKYINALKILKLYYSNMEESYFSYIKKLKNLCANEENFRVFKETMFKRLIVDFFMGQTDRRNPENTLFEKDKKTKVFGLSPMFDFECSFNWNFRKNVSYEDFFNIIIFKPENLIEFIEDSPNNIKIMQTFINLKVDNFFEKFQENRGLEITKNTLTNYTDFCKSRQEILYKCLK